MAIGALLGSWTAKTIVTQLAKKFPKFAPYIDKAQKAGFLAPSILKSLMSKESQYQTEQAMRSEERSKTKRNYGLAALGLVGGAGLGVAKLASRGAAAAAQAGQQPILGTTGPTAPNVPPPPGGGGGGGAPSPTSGSPIPSGQQPVVQAGSGGIYTHGIPKDVMGHQNYPVLRSFILKHAESGHSPEEIESLLKKSRGFAPLVNEIEQKTGKPLIEGIKMIAGGSKPTVEQAPAQAGQPGIPTQQAFEIGTAKKGETVITPMGAGEVHKVHGKDAYIEVDGKLKKVPASEIEPPEQDVVAAVSNILKIPEVDRSSNVALYVYDPDEHKAFFQFHNGEMYKYLDMDPQVVQDIAEKNATPITSGQNQYGAWSPDDPHGSLGAALWAYVLKDPKYAKSKKGEPENPNYRKLQTLYDYWTGLRKKKRK